MQEARREFRLMVVDFPTVPWYSLISTRALPAISYFGGGGLPHFGFLGLLGNKVSVFSLSIVTRGCLLGNILGGGPFRIGTALCLSRPEGPGCLLRNTTVVVLPALLAVIVVPVQGSGSSCARRLLELVVV